MVADALGQPAARDSEADTRLGLVKPEASLAETRSRNSDIDFLVQAAPVGALDVLHGRACAL